MYFALASSMLLGQSVQAHSLFIPQTYQITGLSKKDVLNLRAGPTAQSEDLGDLSSSSKPFEIIEQDETGQWGRLIWGEASAWVSMRYLKRAIVPMLQNSLLPQQLSCHGTEPFWRVAFRQDNILQFADHPDPESPGKIASVTTSINTGSFPVAVSVVSDKFQASILIKPAQCNDGMSDKDYGWSADVILAGTDHTILLSGCCEYPYSQ